MIDVKMAMFLNPNQEICLELFFLNKKQFINLLDLFNRFDLEIKGFSDVAPILKLIKKKKTLQFHN
jgi:hypothetical protein